MRISVTKTDINRGCPYEGDNCPIARAVRRALRPMGIHHANAVAVDQDSMTFQTKTGRVIKSIRTPATAAQFISAFDSGRAVQPFTFQIKNTLK